MHLTTNHDAAPQYAWTSENCTLTPCSDLSSSGYHKTQHANRSLATGQGPRERTALARATLVTVWWIPPKLMRTNSLLSTSVVAFYYTLPGQSFVQINEIVRNYWKAGPFCGHYSTDLLPARSEAEAVFHFWLEPMDPISLHPRMDGCGFHSFVTKFTPTAVLVWYPLRGVISETGAANDNNG